MFTANVKMPLLVQPLTVVNSRVGNFWELLSYRFFEIFYVDFHVVSSPHTVYSVSPLEV